MKLKSLIVWLFLACSSSWGAEEPELRLWPGSVGAGRVSGSVLGVTHPFETMPSAVSAVVNNITYSFVHGDIILSSTAGLWYRGSTAVWIPFIGLLQKRYVVKVGDGTVNALDVGVTFFPTSTEVWMGKTRMWPRHSLAEAAEALVNQDVWDYEETDAYSTVTPRRAVPPGEPIYIFYIPDWL